MGAAAAIELALQWAQKIETEHTRVESEVKLLPIISLGRTIGTYVTH